MKEQTRIATMSAIKAKVARGEPLEFVLHELGRSPAWYKRHLAAYESGGSLADKPRNGRPRAVALDADEREAYRKTYLQSNAGKRRGSKVVAALYCAEKGLFNEAAAAAVRECVKHNRKLPAAFHEALDGIGHAEFARYRDPKRGQGVNDGVSIPGFMRTDPDTGEFSQPGDCQVWDDFSINQPFWYRTRGGKIILGRFQLLACVDRATDCFTNFALVLRDKDAYRAEDAARTMYDAWRKQGWAPREVVLEGGSWQSGRMKRFLGGCGVKITSAKGRPNQKLVESAGGRLWTWMSVHAPATGQVGRFRGEMAKETKDWLEGKKWTEKDKQEGKYDPRKHFMSYDEAVKVIEAAMKSYNARTVHSRVLDKSWAPAEEYAKRDVSRCLPAPHPSLRRHTLPVEEELTMRPNGSVATLQTAPTGEKHQYVFQSLDLHRHAGKKVLVQFDPNRITDGAFVSLMDGTVLAERLQCVSPAPVMGGSGWMDFRAEGVALKKKSRRLVAATVRALDQRGEFQVADEERDDNANTDDRSLVITHEDNTAEAEKDFDFTQMAAMAAY